MVGGACKTEKKHKGKTNVCYGGGTALLEPYVAVVRDHTRPNHHRAEKEDCKRLQTNETRTRKQEETAEAVKRGKAGSGPALTGLKHTEDS